MFSSPTPASLPRYNRSILALLFSPPSTPFLLIGYTGSLRFRLVHAMHYMQFLRRPPVHFSFLKVFRSPWNHFIVSPPMN